MSRQIREPATNPPSVTKSNSPYIGRRYELRFADPDEREAMERLAASKTGQSLNSFVLHWLRQQRERA